MIEFRIMVPAIISNFDDGINFGYGSGFKVLRAGDLGVLIKEL